MALPDAAEITSLYLYGTPTPPADLTDPGLLRPDNATASATFDMDEYMTTGPGRFAIGPMFSIVTQFFSAIGTSIPPGSYTKADVGASFLV